MPWADASAPGSLGLAAAPRVSATLRCDPQTLRWATEGSVSESGVLTDEEASSGVLSCGVLRAQPPMRPSARACGRVTSVDVLLPLGVRAELEARNVAAGAWAAGNQSSAAAGVC